MDAELGDCVVIGGQPWRQGANQTSMQMARAGARGGRRVLYVSRPNHSSQLRTMKAGGASYAHSVRPPQTRRFTSDDNVNVLELGGALALMPVAYPEPLRRLQIRRLTRLVRDEIQRLGLSRPFILMYWPFAPELPGTLGLPCLYDAVDEHHCYPVNVRHRRLNKRILSLEIKTSRAMNAITSVSRSGVERLRSYNSHISHLPNSIDLRSTDALRNRPPGPGKTITYAGGLDARIDWPLVWKLSEARPDWTFQFVGAGHPPLWQWGKNVTFVGDQPYRTALRMIGESNATILPFLINEFTRGSDFLKLLDYLAVGRRVVAADLPSVRELQRQFPGWLRTASTAAEWLGALEDVSSSTEPLPLPDLSGRSSDVRFDALVASLQSAIHGKKVRPSS
jgi:glycosyltransferase involved in cell wall biosynthesis